MTKPQIIQPFIRKGILTVGKGGRVKHKSCWQKNFDDEASKIWNEFVTGYRSSDEAWFCLCHQVEAPMCPLCGTHKVKFTGNTKNGASGFNSTCESCNNANIVPAKIERIRNTIRLHTPERKEKIRQMTRETRLKRYGDANYSLFGSKSFLENMTNKYGNPTYNNPEKIKETNLNRYGVPTILVDPATIQKAITNAQSPEAKLKRANTCMQRYGVSWFAASPDIQKAANDTKRKNIHEFELLHDCTLMATVTAKYGQGYKRIGLEYIRDGSRVYIQNSDLDTIRKYSEEGTHTNGYVSKKEKDLLEYVKTIYAGPIFENDTSTVPNEHNRFFELDMYLPELKLAIDFNGTYWHSTAIKDMWYHQRKTRCALNAGIKIIHVFEDRWDNDRDNICSIIARSIAGTFENAISRDGENIVGDNSLPVFGDVDIISVSNPRLHTVGKLAYYDCGTVTYRKHA